MDIKNVVRCKLVEALKKYEDIRDDLAPVTVAHKMSGHRIYDQPKDIQRAMGIEDRLKNRVEDVETIGTMLENMEFVTLFPKTIEKCLNSNKVFCNRHRFYYTPELLTKSEDEITQIVMVEFFNANQNYFSNGRISDQQKETIAACSLLLMSYIGLIPEKIPYNQTVRRHLMNEIQKRHPHLEILAPLPTDEQIDYMFDFMFNDPDERLAKITAFDTIDGVDTYQVAPIFIFPMEYKIVWINKETISPSESKEIFFKDGKRIGAGTKPAQIAKICLIGEGLLKKRDR